MMIRRMRIIQESRRTISNLLIYLRMKNNRMKNNEQRLLDFLKSQAKNGIVSLTYKEAVKKGLTYERTVRIVKEQEEFTPSLIGYHNTLNKLNDLGVIEKDTSNKRNPKYKITRK